MQIQRHNDGDFLVHIECDLRLVHERKMFVAKDENGELRNPENVPILVRLGRGWKMIEMLGSGTYHNKKEIADMFGMSLPNVSRTIRSAFLPFARHRRQACLRLNPIHTLRYRVKLVTLPLWAEQHALLGIE